MIGFSESTRRLLRCPICRSELEEREDHYQCTSDSCGARLPVVDGCPVLLNEAKSVFTAQGIIDGHETFFDATRTRLRDAVWNVVPSIGFNITSRRHFAAFADRLMEQTDQPRVLLLGGTPGDRGMESLRSRESVELVASDVALGPETALVCDAHDVPFADEAFDGVVIQAVLEHVLRPQRCVAEIYRVLKPGGLVYSETPFMQQVHGGRYDFIRYTPLGHRILFRQFDEIETGTAAGPGMALAWAYLHFLLSFAKSRLMRRFIYVFAGFTSFFLKYFDYLLVNKRGSLDAASSCYFMGRKDDRERTDRELLESYQGLL